MPQPRLAPRRALAGAAALIAAALAPAADAAEPRLGWPVDCTRGADCWIAQFVDMAPAPGAVADPACGPLSYDGHKGTDIAVADRVAMAAGVDVLAAADGTVLRVRDGEADHHGRPADLRAARAAGRECGNGVVVDHGGGLETQYCHLKRGSAAVRPGQAVRRGEVLGRVGQSGLAAFPHLHLSVRRDGAVIDPFSGRAAAQGCDATADGGLWAPGLDVAYDPVLPYAAGFAAAPPDYRRLVDDTRAPAVLPRDSAALVFWVLMFGPQAGDRIRLTITAPDGTLYHEGESVRERSQARAMQFGGRRTRSAPLQPGSYRGTATITRRGADGRPIERRITRQVRVE